MKTDITLPVTPGMIEKAGGIEKKVFTGHTGTHFDVMDKTFPLDYSERKGIVFDVSRVHGRDIDVFDIDPKSVGKDMFVIFYTGHIEKYEYGTDEYFHGHPQLTDGLIDVLLEKGVSLIGIDAPGVRRGKEHTVKDKYCANKGAFVIENLCNLKGIAGKDGVIIHTYPMNFTGMSGLPCRVVAETSEN